MTPPPDQEQRVTATDPDRSVIVQAPAGSGKTTLLVNRYLRLLGRANKPEEILAITFTRKAAAEMRERVLSALRSQAPEARDALSRDAAAGWQLSNQPNRLKIQTIDSFASGLVRQLPLTAEFRPGARLLEQTDAVYGEAVDRLFQRLYQNDPFSTELAAVLALFDNRYVSARRLMVSMLGRRDQWLELVRDVVIQGQRDTASVQALLEAGNRHLSQRIISDFLRPLALTQQQNLRALVQHAADNLQQELAGDTELFRFAGQILTTQAGKLRSKLTRREGFPPEDRSAKEAAQALIETLGKLDLAALADNLRNLPDIEVDPASVDRLSAVAVSLLLCAIELERIFQELSAADFTQLVIAARRALHDTQAPTELALALDYRIRHILVDEFQDTSEAQFRLFELLLQGWSQEDGNSFFAVGDPMQSVYRFRDAEVRVFYDAWQNGIAGRPLQQIRLTSNFRTHEGLVVWQNATFSQVLGRSSDPVLGRVAYSPSEATRDGSRDSLHCTLLPLEASQSEAVVQRIEEILGADSQASIGLLVRSRLHLQPLLPALRAAGIPWRATDIDPLTIRPVVQDLLSLATAMADAGDRLAWFSVLRAPWVGLSNLDLEAFATVNNLAEAVRNKLVHENMSADGRDRIDRLHEAFRLGQPLIHEAPPRAVLETVWLAAGGADAYASGQALADAERFFALVDELGNDAWDAHQLNQAAQQLFAEDVGDAQLEIMTIHKSKGLEFDHVILPFLERGARRPDPVMLLWRPEGDGLLMGSRDGNSAYAWLAREDKTRERHELERLMYVACTRAKGDLHLFGSVAEKPVSGSLLDLLWPRLQEINDPEMRSHAPTQARALAKKQPSTEAAAADLPGRLPPGYRWQFPPLALPQRPEPLRRSARETPAPQNLPEVALGTIVHGALQALSAMVLPGNPARYCEERENLWIERLTDLGVDAQHHGELVAEVSRQLCQTLADEAAQKILSARRHAASELALTGILNGEITNVLLDRTYVDERGQRWIVDYKTTVPDSGMDFEEFLRKETRRHLPQMEKYASLTGTAFSEPLRLALYFTALPRLVDLNDLAFQNA